jgi:CDP-diacylglycerol--glycerol-3-phosphate 3-phosphatidyltransferase
MSADVADDSFVRLWSRSHGDADPDTPFVRGYLAVVHALARPLAAARVPPDALTGVALAAGLAVLAPAAAGGRWPLLVPLLVVLSGLLDGLDGAVAVLTARSTRWGAVLDAVADRLVDAAWCAALWLLGAPAWLAVAAAAVAWLHEYVRARATAAGMTDVGVVTVAERPTRVVVVAAFALGCGLFPAAAAAWATAGAAVAAAVGAAGAAQLLVVVRRRLS